MSLRPRARPAEPPGRFVGVRGSLAGPAVGLRAGALLQPAPVGLTIAEAKQGILQAGDEARKELAARMNGLTSLANKSLTERARQLLRSMDTEDVEDDTDWDNQSEQLREFAQEVMKNARKVGGVEKNNVTRVITLHAQIYGMSFRMRPTLMRVVDTVYDLVEAERKVVTAEVELSTANDRHTKAAATLEHQEELLSDARNSYERLVAERKRLETLLESVVGSPSGEPAQVGKRTMEELFQRRLDALLSNYPPPNTWLQKPDDPRVHATDDSAVIYYVSESEAGAGDSAAEGGEIVAYKFSFAACMDLEQCSAATYIDRESMVVVASDRVQWQDRFYRMMSDEERAELGTSYIFVLDGS